MRISDWSSDVCSSDLAKESRLATANNESGRMLFSNRESYANQLEAQAFTNLNKVTTSGLHGVSGTSFNDAAPAFKGLREGVSREPTLLYAAAEVGVPNGWRSEEHTSELQSLMRISYAVF